MTGKVSVCCPSPVLNQDLLSRLSQRNTYPVLKTEEKEVRFFKGQCLKFPKRNENYFNSIFPTIYRTPSPFHIKDYY